MGSRARVTAGALFAALALACASHSAGARDVILIAKGMTFVTHDRAEVANPPLQLRAGERVTLVLQNEAPGLLHDLVIPAWDVAIDQTRAGERREVTFTVPDTPGRFGYHCRPHSEMMSGVIEVTR